MKIRASKLSSNLNGTIIQQGWQYDPCGTAMRFKLDDDTIQVRWRRLKNEEKATFKQDIDKYLIYRRLSTCLKNRLFVAKDTPDSKE